MNNSVSRPRLLFLAYWFPPAHAVATVRSWHTTSHLSRLGWDVSVVTPDPSLWRHADRTAEVEAEANQLGIRRIFTKHAWRALAAYNLKVGNGALTYLAGGACRRLALRLGIAFEVGWKSSAWNACRDLAAGEVDLVLASGPPFVAFEVARRLAARLKCPYVVNYRDPWTTGEPLKGFLRALAMRKERRILADCAAAITISPSMAAAISQTFGVGDKLHVVTNGYGPEECSGVRPCQFDHFAIVYAGSFFPPQRGVSPLMAALQRLQRAADSTAPAWRFHYYGVDTAYVQKVADDYGLGAAVVCHGRVPRHEVLAAIKGAGLSVVVTSVNKVATVEERGIVTGKIFESIGLGTPYLVITPPGTDVETVVATAGLGRCFAGEDVDGMVAFLSEALHGNVPARKNAEVYAWPNLAKRLDLILRNVVARVR
jgi:glycosyltransferase involved in cell wall biosynthesis